MRNPLAYWSAAVLILVLFACSNRDDRNEIRSRYGEPDLKQAQGKEIYSRELWYYNTEGVGYEFRRTAGCGSHYDTYLYASFYFQPDSSGAQSLNKNRDSIPHTQSRLSTEPRDRVVAPY